MVIQRDKPCLLWGSAPNGDTVTVKVSWNATTFYAVATASNTWQISIPAAPANADPQTIDCVTADSIPVNLKNILIGDVWICSGQSNMEKNMSIVLNSDEEIAAANYPNIRVSTLATDYEDGPTTTLSNNATWTACSPKTASQYSAVAYYFARSLNASLNVPIGIIVSAVGATLCEEWTASAAISSNPILLNYYKYDIDSKLYNGMIYPLKNLSIKGFTWYQGEGNRNNDPVSNYTLLNVALVANWRSIFNQGTLPFYYVQVAPYDILYNPATNTGGSPNADDYAKFREAQANIRAMVPASGMAVTMDVGDSTEIHPANKAPVGERLALLALKNDYNQPVQCVGPQYSSYSVNGNTATISFVQGTATGLNTIQNAPLAQYFFMAGADHVFRRGKAVITGEQVIVTASALTPLPIQAIRYAFTDYPITNLQNSADLPAEPFRTDNWDN